MADDIDPPDLDETPEIDAGRALGVSRRGGSVPQGQESVLRPIRPSAPMQPNTVPVIRSGNTQVFEPGQPTIRSNPADWDNAAQRDKWKKDHPFTSEMQMPRQLDPENDAPTRTQIADQRHAEVEDRRQRVAAARKQREADTLATNTENSDLEAKFRGAGQQFYTDPLTKRLTPIIDTETGRPLFHETPFARGERPDTKEPAMVRRNKFGETEYKRPKIVHNPDLTDDQLYYDMGDEQVPVGRIDDLVNHPDFSVAKQARTARRLRTAAMWKEASDGALEEADNADVMLKTAQEDALGIQSKKASLQEKLDAIDSNPQSTERAGGVMGIGSQQTDASFQLQAQRTALQTQLDAYDAQATKLAQQTGPTGELTRAARMARLSFGIMKAKSKHVEYTQLVDDRKAILRNQGIAEADDPILQSILQAQVQFGNAVTKHSNILKQENGIQTARPAETAPTAVDEPAAAPSPAPDRGSDIPLVGEPAELFSRGVRAIGGVGIREFARRYGSGTGEVSPDSVLRIDQRIKAIQQTIENPATRLDPKIHESLGEEQAYLEQLKATRMARLPVDQQKRITEQTRDPTLWDATKGLVKSTAQTAAEGGGSVLKGLAVGAGAPPVDEDGRAGPMSRTGMEKPGDAVNRMEAIKKDPAYRLGNFIQEAAREYYAKSPHEDETAVSQALNAAGGAAGGFAPLVASGPLAPVTIGLQTAGEEMQTIYDEQIKKGATPDQAADFAQKRALASGIVQGVLFEVLPKPLQKLGNKMIVDRIAGTALKKFLANRIAQATEGVVLGGTSKAAENVTADRPISEGVADSAAGLGTIQAVLPRAPSGRKAGPEAPPEGAPVEPPAPKPAGDVAMDRINQNIREQADIDLPKSAAESAEIFAKTDTAKSAGDSAEVFRKNEEAYQKDPIGTDPDRRITELKADLEKLDAEWQQHVADTSAKAADAPRRQDLEERRTAIEQQLSEAETVRQSPQGAAALKDDLGQQEKQSAAEARSLPTPELEQRRDAIESQLTEAERIRQSPEGGAKLREDLADQAKPKSDYDRYQEIEAEWRSIPKEQRGAESSRVKALYRELEQIKSRHDGMPPERPTASPAADLLKGENFDKAWQEQGGRGGSENQVIFRDGRVYKRNYSAKLGKAVPNYGSIEAFNDHVAIHNELFPSAKIKVEGMSDTSDGPAPVVSQPEIKGKPASAKEIRDYMAKRAFEPAGGDRYVNHEAGIEVSDLRKGNVLKDAKGDLHVIDPVIRRVGTSPETKTAAAEVSAKKPKAGAETKPVGAESQARVEPGPEAKAILRGEESPGDAADTARREAPLDAEAVGGADNPLATERQEPLPLGDTPKQRPLRDSLTSKLDEIDERLAKHDEESIAGYDEVKREAYFERGEAIEAERAKISEALGDAEATDIEANRQEISRREIAQKKIKRGLISNTSAEHWADATIKKARGRLYSGLDPELVAAHAIKGAALLERDVRDFAGWSKAMVRQFGKSIEPHLKELFAAAQGVRNGEVKGAPPHVAAAVESVGLRRRIADSFAKGDVEKAMTYTRDAVDTKSAIYGRENANVINNRLDEAFPKKDAEVARDALAFAVEAAGDAKALKAMAAKIASSDKSSPKWTQRALAAIEFARANVEKMKPIVSEYNDATNRQVEAEFGAGIDTLKRSNYVPHRQDVQDTVSGGGNGSSASGFRKVREFETFADSIAAGIDPLSLNAVDLLQSRLTAGQQMINRNAWVEGLKRYVDPVNKQPVATDVVMKKRADGTMYPEAPRGYTIEFLGNKDIAIQNGYEGTFSALTDPSWWSKSAIRRGAQQANAFGKSTALLVDSFHLGRLAFWNGATRLNALGVMGGGAEAPRFWSHEKGLNLLDQSVGELVRMAKEDGRPEADIRQLIEQKKKLNLAVETGFNVGRITDALHQDAFHNIVSKLTGGDKLGVVHFNKWLFDKFQRGAMSEIWLMEYDRQRAMGGNKNLTDQQVARNVSQDVNTRFGNLGRQGIFKSRTAQDIAKMLILAPQWNEGLIRSELGAAQQIGQSLVRGAKGQGFATGLLARSVVTMVLGQFVANQLLNQATRGKWTWENPEEGLGAKLSAWIPDKVGGGSGFFLHPLGLGAEITHLMMSRWEKTQSFREAAASFARGRLSAIARPLATFVLQTNNLGQRIRPNDLFKEVTKEAVPLPIPSGSVSGAVRTLATGEKSERFPGQFEKQLLSTVGVKTDQAPSDDQRIRSLAHEFNVHHGVEPSADNNVSDYADLTNFLRVGNKNESLKAIEELLVKHTPQQLVNVYKRQVTAPFTGNTKREPEFARSLTSEQRTAAVRARRHREKIRTDFNALLRQYLSQHKVEGAAEARQAMLK